MTPDDETTPTEPATEDTPGVEAGGELLERSQQAIDEAHQAVKDVQNTEVIGDEVLDPSGLPAFAESTPDTDEPAGSSEEHEANADTE